ncbi:MAG: ABC transporter ATP-binding protein [Candidatus Limnocylindria bacterium]
MTSPLLRVDNLRTWFHVGARTAKAVDGVSFEIAEGRTLGLIGESGCGKSVTALSVMGLVDSPGRLEEGSSIEYAGRQLVGMPEREIRTIRGSEIGMIFQEPMSSLNPVYTVGAQIAEAFRAHRDVSRGEARTRAIEMLRLVGIANPEKRVDSFPHEMSGGMRQRVMIASALACEPKLLIADEPTTALDVTIQAQIIALIDELRERLNMAVLLITHDLGVVGQVADEVAVMYAGRIVETGSVEDLFENPQHPYTEALLASIPRIGMSRDRPLKVVRGTVPSPFAWPPACRFADRCEYAFDRCHREEPGLFQVGTQRSACWLCEGGTREASHRTVEPMVRTSP